LKLLLDTHLLLWAAAEPERLPSDTIELLSNPHHELLFSAASLWEITIKSGLGRSDFKVDPRLFRRALLDHGYIELPIDSSHAVAVAKVAQAITEGFTLLTADQQVAQYPGPIRCIHPPGSQ